MATVDSNPNQTNNLVNLARAARLNRHPNAKSIGSLLLAAMRVGEAGHEETMLAVERLAIAADRELEEEDADRLFIVIGCMLKLAMDDLANRVEREADTRRLREAEDA